jgi:HEPN domain-containing protein
MADQVDLARELLVLAADDLTAATALADVAAVSDTIVGFHAQQAAEKALKAVLAAVGHDFPFTHNIGLLTQLCEDNGIALPAGLDALDVLTPYGVAGRYGARFAAPIDRATARDLAAQVVVWARAVVDETAAE